MKEQYLLDTHILIGWVTGAKLPARIAQVISKPIIGRPFLISDSTLWEIAWLVKKKRLELSMPLREWLEAAAAPPLVQVEAVTPAIAAEAINLPDKFPSDPVDRLIAATSRVLGATLITMDKTIIASKAVKTL